MLIVVSIIGILSASILPRINNYLSSTRDLSRKAHLKDIAAALQLYKDTHGTFPIKNADYTKKMKAKYGSNIADNPLWQKGSRWPYVWSINQFSDALAPYLSSIPKDPSGLMVSDLHRSCGPWYYSSFDGSSSYEQDPFCLKQKQGKIPRGDVANPGEYFLLQLTTEPWVLGHAMLFAKMELPENANFVNRWLWPDYGDGILYRDQKYYKWNQLERWKRSRDFLYSRCTSVTKTQSGRRPAQPGNTNCERSDLYNKFYYVVDIQ